MRVLTSQTQMSLWHDLVKYAEAECDITLKHELEAYLVTLLMRYTNRPELVKRVMAMVFMQAMQYSAPRRQGLLQMVGDECLLFAGLFPHLAEKRHVKIAYYVTLGRTAYCNISIKTNDLYASLARHFVSLMDVLQAINQDSHLLPLEAYEQWQELGSWRAYRILEEYTQGLPFKLNKR
ncbi:MAG: hypothetical protein A3E85_01050 [Gammaproteobacteria bacterium RIFCSPHIGHO2_12_FULL_45_12]|nr:MAG: hypothetical protein A3E85_01050 [Gammaproteobacteria bacterium RIFCSPHIGHO2_12_FULL_45_12]